MAIKAFARRLKAADVFNHHFGAPNTAFCLTALFTFCLLAYSKTALAQGGSDLNSSDYSSHRQENYYRNETEADRLYREGNQARFSLDAEKARSLFEAALKADGATRAKVKARICLKSYLPKYKVTPECEKAYKQADLLVQENKLAEGLAAFQALAVKYPKLEWIQIGLATIHLKNDDPERAANCARRALAINPDYVDAWLVLTHDCLMHHDMEGAKIATDKAHELDPYSETVSKAVAMIDAELAKKQPD